MAFILEFESFDKAMGWFTGPEYAGVISKRDEVADFRMAVVEAAHDGERVAARRVELPEARKERHLEWVAVVQLARRRAQEQLEDRPLRDGRHGQLIVQRAS